MNARWTGTRRAAVLLLAAFVLALVASPARSEGEGPVAEMTIDVSGNTVTVTSTKDISHVEVFFCDGSSLKFEGTSGFEWSMTFDEPVAGAEAKSGTTVVSDSSDVACDEPTVEPTPEPTSTPTPESPVVEDEEEKKPPKTEPTPPVATAVPEAPVPVVVVTPEPEPVENVAVLGLEQTRAPVAAPPPAAPAPAAPAPEVAAAVEAAPVAAAPVAQVGGEGLPSTGISVVPYMLGALAMAGTGLTLRRRATPHTLED